MKLSATTNELYETFSNVLHFLEILGTKRIKYFLENNELHNKGESYKSSKSAPVHKNEPDT